MRVNTSITSIDLSGNKLVSTFACDGVVQGDTYTVGAKVIFKGHEYTVASVETKEKYPTLADLSGIQTLAEAIRVTASMTYLR